jgi:hypothetical protein
MKSLIPGFKSLHIQDSDQKNFTQSSWLRSFGRMAQSATTIARTHKIASNNNWLISLFMIATTLVGHCSTRRRSGYLEKNLSAALRMLDSVLDGREGVGCCHWNLHSAGRDHLGCLR